ncbi:MAG TPA: sensor histidine kinase [Burkholderiaceae bacterium]|nr:sensor histidine kinase [Burkholderiaceae bacterium]
MPARVRRMLCALAATLPGLVAWSLAWESACASEATLQRALRLDTARLIDRRDPATPADIVADRPNPGATPASLPIRLPARIHRDDGNASAVLWLEIDLPGREAMPPAPAIYLPRMNDGGAFYLNGAPVFSLPWSDALTRVRWRRARWFVLPDEHVAAHANRLTMKIVNRDFLVDVPYLLLGERDEMERAAEDRQWLDQYGSQFTGFTAAIVGAFMLAIWWARRREPHYLLFGLSSLLWAVRTLNYSVETMPTELWWWWRGFHFLTVALATMTLAAFFHLFAGLSFRRWVWPMGLHAALGPVLVVASDGRLHEFVYRYWQAFLFVFIGIALARLALWGRRTRSVEALVITIGALLATVLAANDYATVSGLLPVTRVYTLHLALPVLLITIGTILSMRFVQALRSAEDANLSLAARLAEKERELEAHYERVAEIERREASAAERQRIMHDMHDGLGAQLVSTLVMVERGAAPPDEVARLLREAMDEMRLAIDAFGQADSDLQAALANLRFRMEPRLKAAGIALDWQSDEAFDAVQLGDERSLHLLRIVQEALSNAMRHSGAKLLKVRMAVDHDTCRVVIEDDGVGLPADRPRAGHGLENMRRRAHALGGEARIDSGPQGTIVAVHFPAPRGDAARPAEDRATGSVVALRPRAAALHPANAASPPRR